MGASTVLDYHEPDWPERVRAVTGGVDAAAAVALAQTRHGAHGSAIVLRPADPG